MSTAKRKNTITSARVTVTVEVCAVGTWGPECQLDQVYRQAEEAAVGRLNNALKGQNCKIVGVPKVEAVTSERT